MVIGVDGVAMLAVSSVLRVRRSTLFMLYSLLALGDLLQHVWKIERAVRAGDLPRARAAVVRLVGRDTDRMDGARLPPGRGGKLEREPDGWFRQPGVLVRLAGIPGLVLFKVVSTMDSDGRIQDTAVSALRVVRRAA